MAIICSTSKPEVKSGINTGELSPLFTSLISSFERLLKIRQEEDSARNILRQAVAEYEAARAAMCRVRLETSGRGWCGVCDSIYGLEKLMPVYIESWDYGPCEYGEDAEFVSDRIVTACPAHLSVGLFTMSDTYNIHFETRFENDKYFALLPKDHNHKKLDLEVVRNWQELSGGVNVIFFPSRVSAKLTQELNLPPLVSLTESSAGWKLIANADGSHSFTQSGNGDDYLTVSDK